MFTTPRRLAVASAALALTLTACGSDDADGAAADPSGSSADGLTSDDVTSADAGPDSSASSQPTDAADPSDGDEVAGSPLEQLFGSMGDSQRFIEDRVATCMRERGWEYEPLTGGGMVMSAGPNRDPGFASQYGYGISTRPPVDELFGGAVAQVSDDPNAAYIESLTPDDRDRFFADLTGLPPMNDEVDAGGGAIELREGDLDPNSCHRQAQRAAAEQFPELSDAFRDRLGELLRGIEDDPAAIEARAAWAACMADADYPYESQQEIMLDLSQRYSQITGEDLPTGPEGDDGEGADGGGVVIARGPGLDGEELDLSPADEERLARLQAEEIAIAQVDVMCAAEHLDAVRADLEREVADKVRSEFPGLGVDE